MYRVDCPVDRTVETQAMLTISKGCGNMVDEQMRSGAIFENGVDSVVLRRLSYDQHNTR